MEGNWSADRLAEAAGCNVHTARAFIQTRLEDLRSANRVRLVGVTSGMWTVLAERALIDRDELAKLNAVQLAGEPVSDKLVSSLVKRLIAVLNIGKSLAPREPGDVRNTAGVIAMNSTV